MSIEIDERFTVDGAVFRICVIDERPEMDLDPTLLLYRGSEEEPVATIHIRDGRCGDPEHISVTAREDDGEEMLRQMESAAAESAAGLPFGTTDAPEPYEP